MSQLDYVKKHQEYNKKVQELFNKHGFELPYAGFSIQKGWFLAFEELLQKINLSGQKVNFEQIKEKFGDLRIYFSIEPFSKENYDLIQKMVTEAEIKCATACEECGKPGDKYTNGWIKTLCESCAKEKGDYKLFEHNFGLSEP